MKDACETVVQSVFGPSFENRDRCLSSSYLRQSALACTLADHVQTKLRASRRPPSEQLATCSCDAHRGKNRRGFFFPSKTFSAFPQGHRVRVNTSLRRWKHLCVYSTYTRCVQTVDVERHNASPQRLGPSIFLWFTLQGVLLIHST